MEKIQTLAEFLGTADEVPDDSPRLEDITDSKAFAMAVLGSREFRCYIVNSLVLGTIPPALLMRMMDYGWGKPPDRVEHSGPDGKAIETITEVRRIIVRAQAQSFVGELLAEHTDDKERTH